jgi:hypothetical protein
MIMKKFYMILAALLIGSVCFAQKLNIPFHKLETPVSGAERSAWVGSTAMDGAGAITEGQEYAIAPKAFDANLSGNITKVKFYHAYEADGENPKTNTSYTIKIYTNYTLGGSYASMGFYELTATEAYTQNFTAGTETGWQEVELTTPFAVPSGDFLVAIKANNGSAALPVGGTAAAVLGQSYFQVDLSEYGLGTMWSAPNVFDQAATLYNVAMAVYVDDGAAYVSSSDFEARFFGGISGNQLTSAEASYTLTSAEQALTLLPFFANNGADDAVDGTVTFAITVDGVDIEEWPMQLDGTEQGSIPVGGWYSLLEEPYSISMTAQEMIDAGLSGTFDVCFTISYTGNDPDLSNNSHCIPVTIDGALTSVNENLASEVSVYPNPANDMFTVANAEGATIVVVNSLGQVVSSIENAASNQTIDASNFANGTYFVKVNESVIKINVVK